MPTDYYDLLGVAKSASEDEIKKAYRRLARELHPDANGGDAVSEERFKEVVLAYETLRDPERRRRYDMFGPEGQRGGSGPTAEDIFGGGFGVGGFGDLFDAFFGQGGGGRSTAGPSRGADAEITLDLAFEEAVFGAEREVTVRIPVTCSTCTGSGARPGSTPQRCETCAGSGEVRRVRQSMLGQMVTASPCPRCRGVGQMISDPCPDCRGEGLRTEPRTYTVEVPSGVDDGSTLRLSGYGPSGAKGGPPGDLYVHLRAKPHQKFKRAGYDLAATEHVAMTQAALGHELTVETLDGSETVAVPAGTQSGKVIRLRGRGVPHVQGRGRGDLLIEIVVDTPTSLTEAQQELLHRLAIERGEDVSGADSGLFSKFRSRLR